MLVAILAAGLAVFRAAGSFGFGITSRTFLLGRARSQEHRAGGKEEGSKANHGLISGWVNRIPRQAASDYLP